MSGVLEAAGVALGAAALAPIILDIISRGCLYLDEFCNANEEADRFAGRMRAVQTSFRLLAKVLFRPRQDGHLSVYDRLDAAEKRQVDALIREFHDALQYRYRGLQSAYGLATPPDGQSSRTNTGNGRSTSRRSTRSALSWIVWGKKRVKAIVLECELHNETLRAMVSLRTFGDLPLGGEAPVPRSTSATSSFTIPLRPTQHPHLMQALVEDEEVRALEFSNDIDVAALSHGATTFDWSRLDLDVIDLRIEEYKGPMDEQPLCGALGRHKVLVDLKHFLPDTKVQELKEPDPAILERIRKLTVQLNRQHSSRALVLRCVGLYRFPDRAAFGFVFKYPDGIRTAPITLRTLLSKSVNTGAPRILPPLEVRLHLALKLAAALFEFHAVGWLHKSIRSSNIVYLPPNDNPSIPVLDQPWLVGFEYSREDEGFSEQIVTVDRTQDIYRHPDTWGAPTARMKFHKIHDIYSLGVVLLEVGLWKSVFQLEIRAFRDIKYEDRFQVQQVYYDSARKELPFNMGTSYSKIVEKCLSGNFDLGEGGSEIATGSSYQEQILERLRKLTLLAELQD